LHGSVHGHHRAGLASAFFIAALLAALFVDFVVLKKQGAHEVGVKAALNRSIVRVALSFAF
jgi:tellurite resistance protein TerC